MTDTERPQKKVYAEVTAEVSFVGENSEAERLAMHFCSRNGINLVGDLGRKPVPLDWRNPMLRVDFDVTYRVHGGWRSDIVKKIQSDADDLGIKIKDLTIDVRRKEIPNECPRQGCEPCMIARGLVPVRSFESGNDKESDAPRKFFSLLRR